MLKLFSTAAALAAVVTAHGDHDHEQDPIAGPHKSLWYNALPGDGGTQVSSHEGDVSHEGIVLIASRPIQSSPASRRLAAFHTTRVLQATM